MTEKVRTCLLARKADSIDSRNKRSSKQFKHNPPHICAIFTLTMGHLNFFLPVMKSQSKLREVATSQLRNSRVRKSHQPNATMYTHVQAEQSVHQSIERLCNGRVKREALATFHVIVRTTVLQNFGGGLPVDHVCCCWYKECGGLVARREDRLEGTDARGKEGGGGGGRERREDGI